MKDEILLMSQALTAYKSTMNNRIDFLIQPEGFDIPYGSEKIHGISTELADKEGIPLLEGLDLFKEVVAKADFLVVDLIKPKCGLISDWVTSQNFSS